MNYYQLVPILYSFIMNNYDVRVTAFGSLNDAQIKHLYLTNKTILQYFSYIVK